MAAASNRPGNILPGNPLLLLQETVGVHGGTAAGGCCIYSLHIVGVGHITGSKHSLHTCAGRGGIDNDISGGIKRKLVAEEVGVGLMPYGKEKTVDIQIIYM